jgi:LuxR family maltose regulon positive regulatory protein
VEQQAREASDAEAADAEAADAEAADAEAADAEAADAEAADAVAAGASLAGASPADADPTSFWNLHGGLAICRAALALLSGDMEAAAQFTRLAAAHLTDENPFVFSLLALEDNLYMILSGDTQKAIASLHSTLRLARQANNLLVLLIANSQLAEMQVLQGQLSQAMATLQKAQYLVVDVEGKPLPVAGIIEIGIGEILYERDFLTEARASLEHGSQATRSAWWISSLDGMVTLARLQQALGDIPASQAILHEASQMALSTESSRWDDVIVSAVAVRLALLRGDLPDAVQWWQRGGFPDYLNDIALSRYPYHVFEYLLLTQVRLLIQVGQDHGDAQMLARALKLLEGLMTEALRFQRVTSQIEILVLQAFAHSALGSDQARADLLRALALGEPEGYRRIFLDEGPALIPLLLQCAALKGPADQSAALANAAAQSDSASKVGAMPAASPGEAARNAYLPTHTYIQSLIDLLVRGGGRQSQPVFPLEPGRPFAPPVDPESNLPVALSARELEVLRLIADGKSNQEIAAQLYLALNTVKRHAYNIYAKLDVKKRTHAVQKARQLGLIE